MPDGVTVFDDEYPGVANLDPDLLQALREAATDAADDGVKFYVNSGWRSPEYQDQLLREAVSEYGSEEEAARWVATADTSAHVSGDAIDIGPVDATAWLSEHGAEYGLCQIYSNEPWHYELRPEADRSRLPSHVRRPYARSRNAAVTSTLGRCRALFRRSPTALTADDPRGDRQEHRDRTGADSFPDHGSGQSRWARRHHRPRAAITAGHAWDPLIARAWQGLRKGRSGLWAESKGAIPWRMTDDGIGVRCCGPRP